MIYLEKLTIYYKYSSNADAYPMIFDFSLVKDAQILLETINAASLSFSGILSKKDLFNY